MTDADRALAQIKAALDAGPTPGPWDAFHKHKYDEWHVSVPLPRGTMRLALFTDGCPTERPQADAEYIAACNPSNMRAIVAHIDAQAAEIKRLRKLAMTTHLFEEAPCFLCGYNGPGYYQPEQHPCAALYHEAMEEER